MGIPTLNPPKGMELTVTVSPKEYESEVRLMAALKMFELGRMSAGSAAHLAGLSLLEFLETCSRYEIPVADAEQGELEAEVAWLKSYLK